jgi:hypothetical protein
LNSGTHPAVIVLNGGDGGIDEYRGAILASHGFAALNLGYLGMDGLPRGLVNIPLEYFGNAIRWMRTQAWLGDRFLDGVSWWRTRVVAWRHIHRDQRCHRMGAKWSSILGARSRRAWRHETALHLDVPGKTAAVSPGEQHQHGNTPTPEAGRPVAFAPYYLRSAMLVSGTDDHMWPSSTLADFTMRRLEMHHHPYPFPSLGLTVPPSLIARADEVIE